MLYSSVGDEDRRRADQVKEERANLEYRQFNGTQDVTATLNDITATGADHLDTSPRMEDVAGAGKFVRGAGNLPQPKGRNAAAYQKVANDTTG